MSCVAGFAALFFPKYAGKVYYDTPATPNLFLWLNIYAMNDLGALYYDGRGCEQDFSKAIYYYEMAAISRQYPRRLKVCHHERWQTLHTEL